MYYILALITFVILYFTLTRVLSSIFKGCLVSFGVVVLIFGAYAFLMSTKEPVNLFNKILIDNFEVRFLEAGVK